MTGSLAGLAGRRGPLVEMFVVNELVLYTGGQVLPFGDRLVAVPLAP